MDYSDHHNTEKYYRDTVSCSWAIAIRKYEYRYSREECPKYRDESTDKDDERKGEDKWKCRTAMNKADNEKPYRGEDSIYESDDRLGLEYETKTTPHFLSNDRPLIIEKAEVSFFYLTEKLLYLFAIDDEKVWEDKCNKEFRQYYPCICDIAYRFLPYRFEVIRADHISDQSAESELQACTFFNLFYKVLSLYGDSRCFFEKSLDLTSNLRKDIHEYEDHDTDEYDIESSNHHIRSSVFASKHMCSIDFSTHSPVVDLGSEVRTKLEEYIGKKKSYKKEYEKITQGIPQKKEETICDDFFPEDFTKDDGKSWLEGEHKKELEY